MTSILEGVIQRGTGKRLKDLNLQLAGKTGTTNNNTDTWFIGFTSNLVVGVYVGYDSPKKLGKYETGSKTALPIFRDFIKILFYCFCMKYHVLKLQCDVFALHCVTKLLFAFIWDLVRPQIHRVQRPVDIRNNSVP